MSDEHPDAPSTPSGPPPYPGAPPPPSSYPGAPPPYAPPPPQSYPGAPPPYAPPPPSYPGDGAGYYPPGAPPPGQWSSAPGPGFGAPGYPGAVPYASYWARVGGFLIDGVILLAVYAIVLALDHGYHMHTTTTSARVRFGPGSELLFLVIGALYASLLIGLRGQTVGMMAARIKAVDANTGGLIGFWRALGRDLFERLLAILLFIPWIIDMLFPAWDPRRQTLHDKVVNTVVIKV